MNNICTFDIFNDFFTLHPDVDESELADVSEAYRYYQKLQGKTIKEIQEVHIYKKLCIIAGQLEIFRYKDYPVHILQSLVSDKLHSLFDSRKRYKPTSYCEHGNEKKRKYYISHALRRSVNINVCVVN